MATKSRYQNPVVNDLVKLGLFTYNSHNLRDISSVEKVDIYFSDETEKSPTNPRGWRIVETIDGTNVETLNTGEYNLDVTLESPKYTIGSYRDVWTLNVIDDEPTVTTEQFFDIYPDLWYTTPIPIVYDFNFHFQPNKLRKGSIQYLIIEIIPNVPRATDLQRYYENLAITSDLKITISQSCGPCVPQEADLRLVVEEASVDYREKRYGYYKLDTTDMDCGIYDVWFKLEFGGNVYISDKMQLQIYD
jgi:hypothetical protein